MSPDLGAPIAATYPRSLCCFYEKGKGACLKPAAIERPVIRWSWRQPLASVQVTIPVCLDHQTGEEE